MRVTVLLQPSVSAGKWPACNGPAQRMFALQCLQLIAQLLELARSTCAAPLCHHEYLARCNCEPRRFRCSSAVSGLQGHDPVFQRRKRALQHQRRGAATSKHRAEDVPEHAVCFVRDDVNRPYVS